MERRMESSMGMTAEPLHQGEAGRLMRAAKALTVAGTVGSLLAGRSRTLGVLSGAALMGGSCARVSASSRRGRPPRAIPATPSCPQRERLEREGPVRYSGGNKDTSREDQRWLLVAAGLLLQFSIGAVYAWSVFAKALADAAPFHLSSVESTLPFEVTIGMIFIGSYIGGRIQDKRGPRPRGPGRRRDLRRRRAARRFVHQASDQLLAAGPRLRRDLRLRARRRLHRADRDAAEVVPRQARDSSPASRSAGSASAPC